MTDRYADALAAGVASVARWADLLDRINVFPVADGDTGRNLTASLAPLTRGIESRQETIRLLLLGARGNSGNIAAQFFAGFLSEDGLPDLKQASALGRERAWQAVFEPRTGTMLSLFDALADALKTHVPTHTPNWIDPVLGRIEQAVLETVQQLPVLEEAGVVDAGALGMFIFMERFLKVLHDRHEASRSIARQFGTYLELNPGWTHKTESGFCVDVVLKPGEDSDETLGQIDALGESAVAITHQDVVKIHLHTQDVDRLKDRLKNLGEVVRFDSDNLSRQTAEFSRAGHAQAIHIMTDGAGSVTADDAFRLNLTVLDSYVTVGQSCLPESQIESEAMYEAMRRGVKVSTSQASIHERHERYRRALERYGSVLYLCVGSVYTGNHQVAVAWKRQNDPEDRLKIIDTGAASGRLGVIVIATARFARQADTTAQVVEFARQAVNTVDEFVFLDRLHYLAAGGRISRTKAFFGDALRMKPVIRPTPQGVEKAGVVRNPKDQLRFALERLETGLKQQERPLVMLEYTDNRPWVIGTVLPEIQKRFPSAEFIVQPLSHTSGAHMGPGTWGVAFLAQSEAHPGKG